MLNYSEIRAILPQGYPMLLVDRVDLVEPGRTIIGIKAITGTEPCYRDLDRGLSAERYAYPTSLLLESFGQTGAVLWLQTHKSSKPSDDVLLFVTARDCRIEGHAFPGDVLRHIVNLNHSVGNNFIVDGETWVDQRRIATIGTLIAVVRSRSAVLAGTASADQKPESLRDCAVVLSSNPTQCKE